MNHENVNESVFEQYIDASVALFMEYYSAALSENIHAEMEGNSNADIAFPEKLDERCRMLIKKECARKRRKQHFKSLMKGLRYVAILATVLLSLFSLLFVTVEAIRIPIINYYIEHGNGYWTIVGQENAGPDDFDESIDPKDPLAGLIPETYHLEFSDGDSITELVAIYEDDSGRRIFLSADPSNNTLIVDSEDAQIAQELKFLGCDGIIVVKGDSVRLAWLYNEASTTFTLIADGLTESDTVSIAERFMHIIMK